MSARSSSQRRRGARGRLPPGPGPPLRPGPAPLRRGAFGLLLALLSLLALLAPPAGAKVPPDRELVDVYAAVEGAQLGEVLPGGPEKFIEVVDSPKYTLTVHAYGETYEAGAATELAWNSSGTEAIGARITIYRGARSRSEGAIRGTVAHEVFHVFEARMSSSESASNAQPGWLEEGAASWVESDLVKNDSGARQFWKEYLRSPKTPLFKRLYDAVGFFGHMASSGMSPWTRFKSIFATTSSEAAYAAAVGGSEDFLDSEASSFFREPGLGSVWDQPGPNVPSAGAVGFKPTAVKITNASHTVTLAVPAHADGAYSLSITGLPPAESIVELTVARGHVRLRSTGVGDVDALNPTRLLLCSDPAGCKCPTSHDVQFQRGDLAVTGGTTGGSVRLVRMKSCETLLVAVHCEGLLPGFSVPGPQILEQIAGRPLTAHAHSPGGSSASTCALQDKGSELTNSEGESTFSGVIAPFVSVVRATTIRGATMAYKIMTAAIPGKRLEGIGDEAILSTSSYATPMGVEYSAIAAVRVHNLIAYFAIIGTPGNTEADHSSALHLLTKVASKL
jgi:hypothetical protein